MLGGQRFKALASLRRELQTNNPMIFGIADPLDETCGNRPVDESYGAVMAQEQIVGHLAHRRAPSVAVTPDGEEELMLGRRKTSLLCLLLAPTQEPP